jgi:hypothetical protein
MLKEDRFRLIMLMIALFAVCLLHPVLTHIYLIIIAPLVVSYFLTPYLAEFILLVHRRAIPKVKLGIIKPRSNEFYYRFRLRSDVGLWGTLATSFYSFLFFISILFQVVPFPTFDYLFGTGSLMVVAVFPFIFLITTVMVALDQSGLRYVDAKDQYIERIGRWVGNKFRGFTGIVAVLSIALKLFTSPDVLVGAYEMMVISVVMYLQIAVTTVLYYVFVLHRDLGVFERILTRKYKMHPQRVEFNLKMTPLYFSVDGK